MVTRAHIEALRAARDAGASALDAIAAAHGPEDEEQAEIARAYLQENVQFGVTREARAGLKRFFSEAADLDLVPGARPARYYER